MIRADFVLRRAGRLVTMVPRPGDPLGQIPNGALAARDGGVVWIGPDTQVESHIRLDGDLVDAGGRLVLPGLVDAHTHPVFAGNRANEFAQRLSGVTYAAQQHGKHGIRLTVELTKAASEDELYDLASQRAARFLAHGITTIEAKSGYGLDLDSERTALRVLARLSQRLPLRIEPTFLGAHVVPDGVDRAAYLRQLIDEMLPAFRSMARWCDVWCDPPAFTPDETRRILARARALGYGLRLHASQLAQGEGPAIAAEFGAASADHLEYITPEQIEALARAGTTAVLCPIANFTVPGSPAPPVEQLLAAGVPVALTTDFNPGTAPSQNLMFALSLACVRWQMTPTQVLRAATVEAARSLRLDGRSGCLRVGSFADCIVCDVETPEEIPYHVGVNPVVITIVGGRVWGGFG